MKISTLTMLSPRKTSTVYIIKGDDEKYLSEIFYTIEEAQQELDRLQK